MLTIDSQEARAQPFLARSIKALVEDVEVAPLYSGDFAALDTPLSLGVERKAFSDFVGSLMDGRLDDQCVRLAETYDLPVLLVEGFPTPDENGNVVVFGSRSKPLPYAWVLSVCASWFGRGLWPLFVKGIGATPRTVVSLYHLAQKEEHRGTMNPKKVLPDLVKLSVRERILLQLPGVGADRMKKISQDSLANMAQWPVERWQEELGKVTGKKVYETWHSN